MASFVGLTDRILYRARVGNQVARFGVVAGVGQPLTASNTFRYRVNRRKLMILATVTYRWITARLKPCDGHILPGGCS
jgi:hypothetical protein